MKLLLRILPLAILCCLLAGCGGGSNNSLVGGKNTGKAVFTVKWPTPSRVVPVASNSIKISILQGANVWTSQLIVKPATTASFSNLPLGTLTVTATAYPNADGSGVAQATASMTINVVAGQVTPVTLTMNSTIAALIPSVANLDFAIGQSATVSVTAQDANGNVVLFSPTTLKWASKDPTIATVDQVGRVAAVATGTTQITATESESNKVATINVVVEAVSLQNGPQRLYIADFGHNQIVRSDDIFGTNEITFGAFGSDPDQFNGPSGIAVGDDNRIYVVDQNNNRIVRMDDMNGTNWVTLPASGTTAGNGVGQFSHPKGIFVDHTNHIYVTDAGNSRIVKMDDMNGTNWTTFGTAGTGTNQFNDPSGICLANTNPPQIYVADRLNNRIVRIDDMTGTNWTTYTTGLSAPTGVFVAADNRIYICNQNNGSVVRINDMTGNLATTFTRSVPVAPLKDPPHDTFQGPLAIYVTPESVLYVADYTYPFPSGGRVVQVFSPADDTNFWPTLGGLSGPSGIVLHTSP